ncbi:uncharacterized protein LOC134807407 [Pan troglodytes]|uniref:uncharacterized protein LOC134807407 n=1 Tax=Pan troglodytes TaxID=9598 RepID=UPI003013CCD5
MPNIQNLVSIYDFSLKRTKTPWINSSFQRRIKCHRGDPVGCLPARTRVTDPALRSLRRQVGATRCQPRAACRGRPPRDRSPPSPPRYLRAAAPGPEACCSSSFSRQAGAARRRRRRPGGRGRSARLAASLLPREAQGPLSRAAAPRPVSSLWLGHGGTAHRRARETAVLLILRPRDPDQDFHQLPWLAGLLTSDSPSALLDPACQWQIVGLLGL